jgi:hypothetical protein
MIENTNTSNTEKETKNPIKNPHYIIIGFFILSRIFLFFIGMKFDGSVLDWCWQCIDETLYKDRFLESLWYINGQPPLFNFFLGAVYKLANPYFSVIFELVFKLISLISALLIYKILSLVHVNQKFSLACSILYLILPFVIIYENWLFYNFPATAILLSICYFFLKCLKDLTSRNLAFCFGWASFLCLYLSMYHIIWYLGLMLLLIVTLGFRSKILIYGLFFLSPIVFWYGKNYVLYGQFAGSTWLGMSLEKFIWPHRSAIGNVDIFGPIKKYKHLLKEDNRYPDVKVLHMDEKVNGSRNLFHIQYLQVSASSMKDFKEFVSLFPMMYLEISSWGFFIFFNPASTYSFLGEPYGKIKLYADIMNLDLMSIFVSNQYNGSKKQSMALIIPLLISSFYLLSRRRINSKILNSLALFIIFNIIYLVTVSSLFELAENNRYRVMINPLIMIYFIIAISMVQKNRSLIDKTKRS